MTLYSMMYVPPSCGVSRLPQDCFFASVLPATNIFCKEAGEAEWCSRWHVTNCRALVMAGRVASPAFDSGEYWRGIHMIVRASADVSTPSAVSHASVDGSSLGLRLLDFCRKGPQQRNNK